MCVRACACLFGFLHSRNDRETGKQCYGGGQVSTVRERTLLKSGAREEWDMRVQVLTEDQECWTWGWVRESLRNGEGREIILDEGTFCGHWSPGPRDVRVGRGLSEIKRSYLGCLGKWRAWLRLGTNFLAWCLLVELRQKTMALRLKECFLALNVALAILISRASPCSRRRGCGVHLG